MLLTNLIIATMTGGYGLISDGAMLIKDGRIAWVGPQSEAPAFSGEVVNGRGRLATPGLIDCHTHLVYGGSRTNEFELRLTGVPNTTVDLETSNDLVQWSVVRPVALGPTGSVDVTVAGATTGVHFYRAARR